MASLGYTADEIKSVEELAAEHNTSPVQILKSALNLYEMRHKGIVVCKYKDCYEESGWTQYR